MTADDAQWALDIKRLAQQIAALEGVEAPVVFIQVDPTNAGDMILWPRGDRLHVNRWPGSDEEIARRLIAEIVKAEKRK